MNLAEILATAKVEGDYTGVTFEKPREIAARVLLRRRQPGPFVEELLEEALAQARLAPPDRRLAQELVYGCVRWERTLDWLIARKTSGRQQKLPLQVLLRLGLYQLLWLDRIPEHAAVHETVQLGKRLGFGPQAGFVNAILRGYSRERESARELLSALQREDLSLGWSHPDWLVQRWFKRWGHESACQLLKWNNTPPETFARSNSLKLDAAQLITRWRAEGVDYDFRRYEWTGENLVFLLKSHPPLSHLASFREGGFYVQDPSTLLAVRELDPQPGELILDLCAAPGGKATCIAQWMQNKGRVIAADVSLQRLELLQENIIRLGASVIEPALLTDGQNLRAIRAPTTASPRPLPAQFDRVLLDAPCSNTGVMRRRVELRWRIQPEEIGRLQAHQIGLLARAAAFVRPGGILVYSTCSLEEEENRQVLVRFLSEHRQFELERECQILPFRESVDGAYVVKLRRSESG